MDILGSVKNALKTILMPITKLIAMIANGWKKKESDAGLNTKI
jgi:hypothetical protein